MYFISDERTARKQQILLPTTYEFIQIHELRWTIYTDSNVYRSLVLAFIGEERTVSINFYLYITSGVSRWKKVVVLGLKTKPECLQQKELKDTQWLDGGVKLGDRIRLLPKTSKN